MNSFSFAKLAMLLGAGAAWAHNGHHENEPDEYKPAPTTPPSTGSACSTSCVDAYRACQIAPNANQAFCASQISSCLGYTPFDNSGSYVTPTACSSQTASATATTESGPAPTSGGSGSGCAASCVQAYRACQGAPDANQSFCASQISSCLGYLPYDNSGSFVTPTACSSPTASATATTASGPAPTSGGSGSGCATSCVDAYRACQGAPNANRSFCASQISSCLGYTPFDNSGSFVTPTACSSRSAVPTAPATGPTSGASDCAQSCNAAYRSCQGAPGANQSLCASNLATCVGYSPFDNSGTLVMPTVCTPKPKNDNSTTPTWSHGNKTTSSPPATYTGGASLFSAAGSLVALVAGAVALLA